MTHCVLTGLVAGCLGENKIARPPDDKIETSYVIVPLGAVATLTGYRLILFREPDGQRRGD